MQHKRKKVTWKRGTETHGHGASKKHRGAGHRGGRGKAGTGKHGDAKIMQITKGKKKYLGKYGFKSKSRRVSKAINVQDLKSIDSAKEKDLNVLNLTDLGYTKLLGKGLVSEKYKLTVDQATETAIKKIQDAGGEVILKTKE